MMADHYSTWLDARLVDIAASEPDAFAELYRRHAEPVLAYCLHRTRDAEAALDATAEIFAAAYQSLPRYDHERGGFRGWLFGIANHKLSSLQRTWALQRRARRRLGVGRLEFHDRDLERVEELIDLERSELPVMVLVGDLPASEREAVLARVVDELDYAEVAAQLHCSQGAARKRVSRGLARLSMSVKEQKP